MNPRILMIEDDLKLVEHFTHILSLANYQVIHALNGFEGVEKAISNLPDLIISGISIPELNGYGVIQILHLNEETGRIPFIFVAKNASREEVRKGMNHGADDFITKTIGEGDLLKTVELRLKKRCKLIYAAAEAPKIQEKTVHKDLEINDIKLFFEDCRYKIFKKKDFIFMEGQLPGNLYLIKSGKVKIFKTNFFGKELITSVLGAGEFLGYLPILIKTPYQESAEALEELEVQVIPKNEFLSLLYTDLGFALFFIQLVSKELIAMEDRMIDLAYQPVRQRVARVILNLGRLFAAQDNSNSIAMSRRDISSIIGTAPETLNRMLSEFKDEGLIELKNDSGLTIINSRDLLKVAKS